MSITVNLITYRGIYRSLEADKINVPSSDGRRGILPNHVSVIMPLEIGVLNVSVKQQEYYFAISRGMLLFENNTATILSDSIIDVEDIQQERIEKKLKKTQEYLDTISDERDIIMAKVSLAKTLNKLEAKSKYGKK
ncbi:MAG: ATP synthase F1 subunit epsilon [Erysipelotrichaceae bacterium]